MLTFPEYRLQSQLAVKFRAIEVLFANALVRAWCNQIERDSFDAIIIWLFHFRGN